MLFFLNYKLYSKRRVAAVLYFLLGDRNKKGFHFRCSYFSVNFNCIEVWNSYMWDSLISFLWFFFFFLQSELCFCFVIYNTKGIRPQKLLSGIVVFTFVPSFVTFYIFQRRSAVLQWAKKLILQGLNFSWAMLWSCCVVLGK